MQPKTLLVVAAALTDPTGRVLIAQRPAAKEHGGLWEFPGGKVEPDETPEAALARELFEEIGVEIDPCDFESLGFASESRSDRQLVLLLYRCRAWRGEAQAIEPQALAWVRPDEMAGYAMPPADVTLARLLQG